jgi:chromosome segregation ATPase
VASADPILKALSRLEENLVQRISEEMDRRFVEVDGRFDAIQSRLDRLETEYQMIVAGLKRIEEALNAGGGIRARLQAEVVELRSRVADLDARIREIEAQLAEA